MVRGAIVACLVVVGCGSHSKAPGRASSIALVTSSIVVDQCPVSKQVNAKRASAEIEAMVSACKTIPGGKAHFSATLLPDGRVELASPEGDPDTGIVPTCLLQSKASLRHRLRLSKPCKFDVQLEEQSNGAHE